MILFLFIKEKSFYVSVLLKEIIIRTREKKYREGNKEMI
jgi:hypothetical protein